MTTGVGDISSGGGWVEAGVLHGRGGGWWECGKLAHNNKSERFKLMVLNCTSSLKATRWILLNPPAISAASRTHQVEAHWIYCVV